MKNKITIKVCGESKPDNLVISKYFTLVLRLLGCEVSNTDYPVNDDNKTYFLAKHMDKLIKKNIPLSIETSQEMSSNAIVDKMLDDMLNEVYPKRDQFSDIFPDKPISIPINKKKKKSVTDYPSDLNC